MTPEDIAAQTSLAFRNPDLSRQLREVRADSRKVLARMAAAEAALGLALVELVSLDCTASGDFRDALVEWDAVRGEPRVATQDEVAESSWEMGAGK